MTDRPRPAYRPMHAQRLDPAPAAGVPDACDRTHNRVRLERTGSVVHRLNMVIAPLPNSALGAVYLTACGQGYLLTQAVRTSADVTCTHVACAAVVQKHERPETVATPSGPCHGGAAKQLPRPDATGNSVTIRPAEDSFRSVKSAAANRVNGHPRSQVATASAMRETTSSGRASGPSKGEQRVLESVAPVRLKAGPTSPVQSGMT